MVRVARVARHRLSRARARARSHVDARARATMDVMDEYKNDRAFPLASRAFERRLASHTRATIVAPRQQSHSHRSPARGRFFASAWDIFHAESRAVVV